MKLSHLIFFAFVILSVPTQATITYSASGYSNVVTSGSTTTYYVSNIGSGYTFSTSCSTAINPNCKNPGASLSLSVTSSVGVSGSPIMYWVIGSVPTTGTSFASLSKVSSATYSGGATISLTSSYSNICAKGAAVSSQVNISEPNCQFEVGSAQMSLILDANGSGTYDSGDDLATFTIAFQNSIPQTTSGSLGLYAFTLFPGDGEFLIKEPHFDGNYPGENSGIQYVNFYYSQTADGNEATTLGNIYTAANSSPSTTPHMQVSVADANGNLSSYYIGAFDNDTKYCVIASLVDNAGNYGYLMDSSGLAAQATSLCSTPSQIAGLLSKNGQCFIATAAFGSPLQKEVLTFRQFRNRYLLPHKLGRQFVSWYYKHSPPWAQKISDNPSAKAVTRAFLWPLAQILKVVLNWGLGAGLAILGVIILAPFFIITRIKKARSLFSSLFFLIITFGLASIVPSLVFAAPQSKLKQPPLLIEKKSEPEADVEEEAEIDEEDKPDAESPEKIEAEAPKNEDGIEYSNDPDLGVEVPLKEKSIKDQGIMYSEPEKPKSSDDEAINAETIKNPHRKKKNFDDGSPSYRVNAFGDRQEGGKLKKKFRDGTYLYKVKPSPQKYSGGFRIGPYTPADLHGDVTTVTYQQLYGKNNPVTIAVDLEWQFFQKAGKLGLQGGIGFFTAAGQGRFLNPSLRSIPSETIITLYCFPLQTSLLYHFQYSDKQPIVPFAGAGLDYFGMLESRDDRDSLGEKLKVGGAPAAHWVAGLQIQLDFLDRDLIWNIDRDYGINHVYLTFDARQILGLSRVYDFTGLYYEGGVLFEF